MYQCGVEAGEEVIKLAWLSSWKQPLLALLTAMLWMPATPAIAVEKCPELPAKVNSAIDSFNDSVRGAEYCEFRDAASGDLDGDGRADFAVRFTIEGACHEDAELSPGACGNNYEFFLIAYLAKSQELISPIKIGGKAVRHLKEISVRQNKVFLDALEYADGDAMCCPSMKKNAAYQVKQGRFIEVVL